ncbi:hypothetical protein LPJ73_002316 [Coemansia sp. RSA 2703]|nr:hypothetical protein LPJ73_002316 [Coemansia sp. RSA 2703]KAJ2368373.1 hypothetical protein IW150_005424 [Coemansia sp. RSA 2607]KAJ2382769.1 hypothetical protein GGI05_005546 [Coemansia sp. RSA 2603]
MSQVVFKCNLDSETDHNSVAGMPSKSKHRIDNSNAHGDSDGHAAGVSDGAGHSVAHSGFVLLPVPAAVAAAYPQKLKALVKFFSDVDKARMALKGEVIAIDLTEDSDNNLSQDKH